MEKVSIIIPVYNVEKYLKKCLDSITNQSYKNLEIIIIDDGSTDNSLEIAKGFEKNDSRIKLLTQKNSGVSEARNVGIKTATGKYITFVDSDDWLELDMYEKLMERIENPYKYLKPDIMLEGKDECDYSSNEIDSIIYSFTREYKDRSEAELIPFDKNVILVDEEIYSKWILNLISGEDERESYIMASIWRCIYRKDIIDRYNILFDKELSYAEDLVFNLKYFINSKKIYIYNEALYHYRFNTNSAVTKYDNELWKKNLKVNEVIDDIFNKNEDRANNDIKINNDLKERINSRLISVCVGSLVNIFHEDNKESLNIKYKKVKDILNDKKLVDVKKNYNIKNKKYKLLTSNIPIIPIAIINLNKIKKSLIK